MNRLNQIIKYTKEIKLLYVEDNNETREEMLILFNDIFYTVVSAVDGNDGFNKYKDANFMKASKPFDLIITDINMPNMDGLEMIQKIKEIDTDISILMLSAHNDDQFFTDSIRVGILGYLLKPFEMKQFIQIMVKIIDNFRLKKESKKNLNFLLQYQNIVDDSAIVSKTDTKGIITYANDEFCKMSGYKKDELIGKPHNIIRDPNTPSNIYKQMWDTIKNKKQVWRGIIKNITKDGHSYYVKSIIKPILDIDDNIVEYIALRDDITDIMSPKKQLEDLVNSVDEAVVILIQIEDFDDIQKYYGKDLVYSLENKFSKQIYDFMPSKCEFEKVYPLGEGKYAFAKDKKLCTVGKEKVLKQLKEFQKTVNNNTNLKIDDFDYDISIIISFAFGKNALENSTYGISKLVQTKQDFILANDLIQQEQEMASSHLQTLRMVKEAIQNYNIVSYFQPIVDNRTQQIVKYESLVRLIDKDNQVISPFFFLDVAKKGKYYSQITSIVLDNSFNILNYTNMDISINISALDIEKISTREKILELLRTNQKKAKRVVFEILEDEEVKDFKLIKSFIAQIKKFGVKIAIDDFGSGYSSFERILDYQPDILKIDGSLIKNITNNDFSLSVVKTIVVFAKEQNMKIIAEYVENEDIFNLLCDLGVDYSQGYYFSEPKPLKSYDKPEKLWEINR